MAKKPEPPKPISCSIYKIAAKAVRLVEAPDEANAIDKAAAESKVPAMGIVALPSIGPSMLGSEENAAVIVL